MADYTYDPASGERRAVVRLFKGLVHTVVKRIIQTEEPDFIMETHTAVIGVRGTDWYTLLAPSYTSVYLAQGTFGRQFQSPHDPGSAPAPFQALYPGPNGQSFFPPQPLTPEILRTLEQLMDTGLVTGGLGFGVPDLSAPYSQFPNAQPGSPDQRMRLETIPPTLIPQPQMPAPTPSPSPR